MTQATMDTMMTSLDEISARRESVPAREKCPYCKGSGFELVLMRYPDFYGPDSSPVEVAVPCRTCEGRRKNFQEETKSRFNLPYDAFISAFNPSAYVDEEGKLVDFSAKYKFVMGFIEKFRKIQRESDIKGLYIHSSKGGTGKTFLASIICNELYSRYQVLPLYVTENTLLDELSKTVGDAQIKPREQYKTCQLLFIDDMWRKRTGKDWVIDELFTIIDYRYTHGLCTIVTSNLALESPSLDKRIASRLNDMCASIAMPEIEIRSLQKPDSKRKLMDILNE